MTDYRQYRIIFHGTTSPILDKYPGKQWSEVSRVHEQQGGYASLQCRLITDADILPMLTDSAGFMKLPSGVVVSPWETLAELPVDSSKAILIG